MRKRRYSAVASVLLSAPALAADSGFNKASETLSNTSTGLLDHHAGDHVGGLQGAVRRQKPARHA